MNRHLFFRIVLSLLIFTSGKCFAVADYWHFGDNISTSISSKIQVDEGAYSVYILDQTGIRNFLFNLSTQFENAAPIVLPTPDRHFTHFHIWKTPAMEKGLADKYPDIQTFTAVSDDDPAVTAKVEYTLLGFSALIYDGNNTYFIQSCNEMPDGNYIAYYRSGFKTKAPLTPCLVASPDLIKLTQGLPTSVNDNTNNKIAARLNGSTRRTYRFALSCTGEYAHLALANPTKPLVLSEMVASTNHINGFYERELAISMQLIANNDAIIYTDTATDPYTCNLVCDCLIGEANDNVKNVIGVNNFDIGFTMCTAPGGLAGVGSLCDQNGKAAAVGYSSGANDVDVLLHEMGHQFGGSHTFNANTGGCLNAGDSASAYEPGAGISTMSYSGGCDPNSVGVKLQPYYHVKTLIDAANHIASQPGCGTTSAGITPPVVPEMNDTFRIPQNTPFELTAPEISHAANVGILYNWEQWDLGNFKSTEANNANALNGPLFRSYDPTEDRIRPYPTYANIIAGTYGDGPNGAGLRISKKERDISFKLTVRGIYQGWGTYAINDRDVKIRTARAATGFRVHQPDTDMVWNPGEHRQITWDVAGSDGDTVKCGWVNIYFSEDNGVTFPYLLVANAPNTGSYTVTVPNVNTSQGRLKVKAVGNIFFDIGKGKLTVTGSGGTAISNLPEASHIAVYPNPAANVLYIENKDNGMQVQAIIYNALGQPVWSGRVFRKTVINTQAFSRGTYIVSLTGMDTGKRSICRITLL